MNDPTTSNRVRMEGGRLLAMLARKARRRGRAGLAATLYGGVALLDPHDAVAQRERRRLRPRAAGERTTLRNVALGTTGLCNASCIHCPTGKAVTAHVPRNTMDMSLFEGIIDDIHAQGWTVQSMNFGVFGDGLVDPLVVERARYARARLPDLPLNVNTNGAAFDAKRHAPLAELVSLLSLHCESIRPATYDRLMTPLRAANVFPKYERILEVFAGKLRVSIPVSRMNLPDLEETRDWFTARGAHEVVFDPMASRCTDDQALFRALALAPVDIACPTGIMDEAIIDCDGAVLACCQDFERREIIGDVAADGLVRALDDPRRAAFAAKLAAERHAEIATCSRCHGDVRTPDFPFDQLALASVPAFAVG